MTFKITILIILIYLIIGTVSAIKFSTKDEAIFITNLLLWPMNYYTSISNSKSETYQGDVDVSAFINLAKKTLKSDPYGNDTVELWTINSDLVYYQLLRPNTSDGNYKNTLYGKTPAEEYCSAFASVGGPRVTCKKEEFRSLFNQINTKKPNIGLGPEYKVTKIYN